MALLTGRRQIPVARISLFLNETPTNKDDDDDDDNDEYMFSYN